MELAEPDVGRDSQHGADNLHVKSMFSAEPATIDDFAPSERRDGVKEVKFGRNSGSKCVSNIQGASQSCRGNLLATAISASRKSSLMAYVMCWEPPLRLFEHFGERPQRTTLGAANCHLLKILNSFSQLDRA